MTYSELNAVIPVGEYTSLQIETIFEWLNARGIELAEDET